MAAAQKNMEIETDGFAVIEDVFSGREMEAIASIIEAADINKPNVRSSGDVFAIRQFFKEVPGAVQPVFNAKLKSILTDIFGSGYFVVKSIYFDKPSLSNWFVAYHQDLTVSVAEKHEVDGFCNFTVKNGQFAVQPPVEILKGIFTVRIHLDDTNEHNGALKVVPGSHKKGIINPGEFARYAEKEAVCPVNRGGIMIMKPLLLHASGRTTNNKQRRVIHIELAKNTLPAPLEWGEKQQLP